ncbi:TipAS antibiotic-recognition domain-containing protein [Gorillibacterium sp. CAU 1737]|uniref:TipAS antibiotic-recognition domain-containing protein n=1 Tax=Gorillibacterium sp. CAU 1737 TaxID=3140362 RepID=UPI003260A062
MTVNEFNLSEYFRMLEEFRKTHEKEIGERFGSCDKFDQLVVEMKAKEAEVAELALKQYGSLEELSRTTKHNLLQWLKGARAALDLNQTIQKTEELMRRVTADRSKDVSSEEVQQVVHELVEYSKQSTNGLELGEHYWSLMGDYYLTNPVYINSTDQKYGEGASTYIGKALKAYQSGIIRNPPQ